MLSLVLAAALTASPKEPSTEVVIVTGGVDEAAARANLEAFAARFAESRARIELPPGFPRLQRSDDLPGLKPGFFIVVAGFCSKRSAAAAVAALRPVERGTYSKPTTVPQPLACPAETLRRIVAAGATEHPSRPAAAPNLVAVQTTSGVEVLQVDAEGRVIDRWVDPTQAPEASAPGDEGSISKPVISVEQDAYVVTVTTSLWQPSQMCRIDQPITFRVGLKRGVTQALQRRVGREARQCGE